MTQTPNTTRHPANLSDAARAARLGQTGMVLWFTGLSGSGKSTLAYATEARLVEQGRFAFVLDGDNLRHGLCGNLGFSEADRKENVRRVAEVARLFADANVIALVSLVSPFSAERARAKEIVAAERFFEIHVATSLEECEKRDPKGLYHRARAGDVRDFPGIDVPYEAPQSPDLKVDHHTSIEAQVASVEALIRPG